MGDASQPDAPDRDLIVEQIIASTGIDEAMIDRLVRSFYGKARQDPQIGPIFESKVDDWEAHFARMNAFWSSVALISGRYHGQPMAVHMPLPMDTPHFDRWLEIFAATAREVCPPAAASYFLERAHRIADSLKLGIAFQKKEIRPKRVRPPQTCSPTQTGSPDAFPSRC
jgi:hemoglobin